MAPFTLGRGRTIWSYDTNFGRITLNLDQAGCTTSCRHTGDQFGTTIEVRQDDCNDLNDAVHSWSWSDVWSYNTNFGCITLRLVSRPIWSYDHLIERKRMAFFTLHVKFHATASSADCKSFVFLVAY